MSTKVIIAGVVILLLVVGVVVFQMSTGPSGIPVAEIENESSEVEDMVVSPPMDQPVATDPAKITPGSVGVIPLTEIAKHSKAEDCWMAIEGKVYDATPYIQKQIHPGGAAILFGCGKDSTAVFNLRPKDNKPHSSKARGYLEQYYIGELAK